MKIGIYARGLSEKSGGTKRMIYEYTKRIISQIPAEDELYILHNCENTVFNSSKKNVHEVIIKTKNKLLCDYVLGPREIRKRKLESVWVSKTLIPLFYGCKTVVSITDLASFYDRFNSHPYLLRKYMNFIKFFSAKYATKVHAISDATKEDIIKFTKVKKEKVKTIYLAADEHFKKITDKTKLENARKKYSLPKNFLLFFGMVSPRKNIKNLILAFQKLNPDYHLILAGGKGWNDSEEFRMIKDSKNIRHIGKVDEEDMSAVYSLATAFVFPSFYEGFGLPIIEAQSCGCPVICSKTSSLYEIGKDSAVFFDPYDVNDMAKKIKLITEDNTFRKNVISKGLKNAKRFSWEKETKQLLGLLK